MTDNQDDPLDLTLTDEDIETFENLGQSIRGLAQSMSDILTPAIEGVSKAAESLHNAFQEEYRRAGSPYGHSHEGLMRWVKEMGEIKRLENEADRIRQRHFLLAGMSKGKINEK